VVLVNDNSESRQTIDACVTRHKTCLNPIIDWSDAEVWEFIKAEQIPYCGLYDEGWTRLGCIGCPMARQHGREREFARWPKYKAQYIRTFGKMLEARKAKGKYAPNMKWGATAQDVFNWWMEYDTLPGQLSMFEEYEEMDDD
jgi:phosphoadenosine phosphosulfate reductase